MTPQEAIKKWLGKRVDFDGGFGYQCVDWARQFSKEVFTDLGTFGGSAYNGWTKWFGERWERTYYKAGIFPTIGCIVFLGKTKANPYGHVAVSGESTKDSLVLIEQNAATGNGKGLGGDVITQRTIAYNAARWVCLWWFRYLTNADMAKKIGIWNGERPKDTPTRHEVATMVSRASKKPEKDIWNSLDPDNKASSFEINTMTIRGFGTGCGAVTREDLAAFCYTSRK